MSVLTGYVSRCGSDSSDSSSDLDMEPLVNPLSKDEKPCPRGRSSSDPEGRKRRDRKKTKDGKEKGDKPWGDKKPKEEKDNDTEKDKCLVDKNTEDKNESGEGKQEGQTGQNGPQIQIEITSNDVGGKAGQGAKLGEEVRAVEEQPSVSEASDSFQSDSRVLTSPSSDSLDALEEDDLISCSSSSIHPSATSQTYSHVNSPLQLHHYSHSPASHFLAPPPAHCHPLIHLAAQDRGGGGCRRSGDGADPQILAPVAASLIPQQKYSDNFCTDDSHLCFAELSRMVDFLPSPPEASEDDEDVEEELRRRSREFLKELDESVRRAGEGGSTSGEGSYKEHLLSPSKASPSSSSLVFNFDQSDARCYYKLCSNITPDSARSLSCPQNHGDKQVREAEEGESPKPENLEPIPILQPPPGFGDSSSDEEFFDARDRFTSPEDPTSGALPRGDLIYIVRLIVSECYSLSLWSPVEMETGFDYC